jgi:hypothetical protein
VLRTTAARCCASQKSTEILRHSIREIARIFSVLLPVLRARFQMTSDQLAMVSVVQREWAAKNPRAIPGEPALAGRPEDADHRRGRAELADDRPPVPIAALLPGDRWQRRADPRCGRARPRLPAKLAPGSEQGGRSACSAPASLSRRRWSAKWRISPRHAPSTSPAPRPLPRPASPTTTSTT